MWVWQGLCRLTSERSFLAVRPTHTASALASVLSSGAASIHLQVLSSGQHPKPLQWQSFRSDSHIGSIPLHAHVDLVLAYRSGLLPHGCMSHNAAASDRLCWGPGSRGLCCICHPAAACVTVQNGCAQGRHRSLRQRAAFFQISLEQHSAFGLKDGNCHACNVEVDLHSGM